MNDYEKPKKRKIENAEPKTLQPEPKKSPQELRAERIARLSQEIDGYGGPRNDRELQSRKHDIEVQYASVMANVAVSGRTRVQLTRKMQYELTALERAYTHYYALKVEKAQLLLRSPEEESEIAGGIERGGDQYIVRKKVGESELFAFGTAHRFELEAIADMVKNFENEDPDIILVEGEAVKMVEQLDESLGEKEVIKKGEQVFMAWLAKKSGKEIGSWDLSPKKQLIEAVKKHGPDAVLGWIIGQGTKHIFERKGNLTTEELVSIVQLGYGEDVVEKLQEAGCDLSQENLERLAQRYVGKRLADITAIDAEKIATSRVRGETNDVLRDMNLERDKRAIEVIAQAKKKEKKIFVTAGGSHVITWENALGELYGD